MKMVSKSFLILTICTAFAAFDSSAENSSDALIRKLCGDKKGGVFLDIGAFDGITNSKTYYLEKALGWLGACVECSPSAYEKLRASRLAVCINAAIAPESGILPFLKISIPNASENGTRNMSGLLASFEPQALKGILEHVYNLKGRIDFTDMPCFTFAQLIEALGLDHINLLNMADIDNKLEVLKTIDFNIFDIDVIVVKNKLDNHDIQMHLIASGFTLLQKIESEEIYRNINYL